MRIKHPKRSPGAGSFLRSAPLAAFAAFFSALAAGACGNVHRDPRTVAIGDSGADQLPDAASAQPPAARPLGDVMTSSPLPGFTVRHTFETEVHGWTDLRHRQYGVQETRLALSPARASEGQRSLEVAIDTAGEEHTTIGVEGLPLQRSLRAGMRVRYHLFLPSKAGLLGVQAYLLAFVPGETEALWVESASPFKMLEALTEGQWNEIEHQVPADALRVVELGLEFVTRGPQKLTLYLDDISY
jgi:hypothetical protein